MQSRRPTDAQAGSLGPTEARLIQESFQQVADAFASRSAVVDTSIGEMKAGLKSVDVILRGNGKEGLVTQVSNLNTRLEAMTKELESIKSDTKRFVWWLIGILVSMLGAMITTFIIARMVK